MSLIVCLVTCPSKEVAVTLARQLVNDQLAACVNIVPEVTSVYRWEGEVCVEGETLLMIKSSQHLIEALRDAITEHHPYELPEFVVLDPSFVSEGYKAWVGASVLPRA